MKINGLRAWALSISKNYRCLTSASNGSLSSGKPNRRLILTESPTSRRLQRPTCPKLRTPGMYRVLRSPSRLGAALTTKSSRPKACQPLAVRAPWPPQRTGRHPPTACLSRMAPTLRRSRKTLPNRAPSSSVTMSPRTSASASRIMVTESK